MTEERYPAGAIAWSGDHADEWITWAARRARENEDAMRALGMLAPLRGVAEARAVIATAPERR